jgi:hypothetical protein
MIIFCGKKSYKAHCDNPCLILKAKRGIMNAERLTSYLEGRLSAKDISNIFIQI